MGCPFCSEGKMIKVNDIVNSGRPNTMGIMLTLMFGSLDKNDEEYTIENVKDGVMIFGSQLIYDNSSGEYTPQIVDIKYCPMCGRKL